MQNDKEKLRKGDARRRLWSPCPQAAPGCCGNSTGMALPAALAVTVQDVFHLESSPKIKEPIQRAGLKTELSK